MQHNIRQHNTTQYNTIQHSLQHTLQHTMKYNTTCHATLLIKRAPYSMSTPLLGLVCAVLCNGCAVG